MILYFSATGNSAFAAKRIAERIGDEAVSLLEKFRTNDHSALCSEKPWVVVSPVYVAEMPRIVSDWLKETPLTASVRISCTAPALMVPAGSIVLPL